MELHLPADIKPFFSKAFPFVVVLISYYQIFHGWELQQYGFNEIEDIGRLLFVLAISAMESAFWIIVGWFIFKFFMRKKA